MKIKPRICQKFSCFVASFVGFWTISPNLGFCIFNLGFVQHFKDIILPENVRQNKAEEENEKKNQGFAKKFPAVWTRALVRRSLGY
jgi:hypothetical protein